MSRPRFVSALVGLALTGTLMSTVGPAAVASERSDPAFHQPPDDACYRLTSEDVGKPYTSAKPVPCTGQRTTMTLVVHRVNKDYSWKSLPRSFYTACQDAMVTVLGGSKRLAAISAYDWWYFMPTKRERAQGARWLRCDLALSASATRLKLLPRRLAFNGLVLPPVRRCLVGDPLRYVTCSVPHGWVPTRTVKLARYPESRAAYLAISRRCYEVTDPQTYVFDIPSEYEFKMGRRIGVCYLRGSNLRR